MMNFQTKIVQLFTKWRLVAIIEQVPKDRSNLKYICGLLTVALLSVSLAGSIIHIAAAQGGIATEVVPMPIALDDFTLSSYSVDDQIGMSVEWKTSREIDVNGFYIWRSTTRLFDDAIRISPWFESAGSEEPDGMAQYAYLDFPILSGVCYSYWLQEVPEVQGSDNTIFYGPLYFPAIGSCKTLPKIFPIYLPIIER